MITVTVLTTPARLSRPPTAEESKFALQKTPLDFWQTSGRQLALTCVFIPQVKYKEGWQKTKGRGFEMKLDAMSLLAAKASGELASNVSSR